MAVADTRDRIGLFICAAALVLAACTADFDERVSASGVVFDMSTQALRVDQLYAAHGYYMGCAGRYNGQPWTLLISAGGEPKFAALTVELNDDSCELVLTKLEVVIDDNDEPENPANWNTTTILAESAIALTESWRATGVFFDGRPAHPSFQFFANARLVLHAPGEFSGDFVVEILFSDDPDIADSAAEHQATFAVVTGSYATETVKAPAYTLDSSEQGDLDLDIRSDAHNIVVFIDGSINLALDTALGAQGGQDFVVHGGASLLGSSYDDVHAAFGAAVAAGEDFLMPALDGDGYSKLPADPAFLCLMGEDLGAAVVERTVIIRNATRGVASYQTFTIQFPQPVEDR